MVLMKYSSGQGGGLKRSSRPEQARSPDVVICYSDSEAWDYMPLVRSVIPANLGFSFTLHCGHSLRLERTGSMEIQMACLSTGFVC